MGYGIHQEFDKCHSRIERRTYYVWNDASCVFKDEWPDVAAVGMVVRERLVIDRGEDGEIMDEEPTVETESYIISRRMNPEEFACFSRHHWAILCRRKYYPDFSLEIPISEHPA